MNFPLLYQATEFLIKMIHLQPADEQIVRKCVSRYTRPCNFSGIMKWMVYRLENAIKSIFGKSDWQIAKKVIQKHYVKRSIEVIATERHFYLDPPKDNLAKILENFVVKLSISYTNKVFPVCLLLNREKIEISDKLKEKIEAINLEIFLTNQQLTFVDAISNKYIALHKLKSKP